MQPFPVTADSRDSEGRPIRRQRRFAAPTRGVRTLRDDVSFETRCDAALLALPSNAVLAEATAARLWELPLPSSRDVAPIVAVVPSGSVHPRRELTHVFRRILRPGEVTTLDGRPLTTPARTFADCARLLSLGDALALGDAALAQQLMTHAEASDVVRALRRLRGIPAARRALGHLDPRSRSPQESRVRAIIINAELPLPVPNLRINDACGGFVAVGDLVYPVWLIVIEYDGSQHLQPGRHARDATRRTRLRELGWYVVELTSEDVRWPNRAEEKIRRALQSRGAI